MRAFFGHTRFATSSKATLEGTHPHMWSERRSYKIYHGSSSSNNNKNNNNSHASSIPVENYVTHNGDFEFFRINNKYYDVQVIQHWLQHVLDRPMPATVDSAAIAGVIDLLRCRYSFALSVRCALCLGCEGVKVEAEPVCAFLTMEEYEVLARYFEEALDRLMDDDNGKKTLEECSTQEMRSKLTESVMHLLREQLNKLSRSVSHKSDHLSSDLVNKVSNFLTWDVEEGSSLHKFVRGTIDAFFDNDLLHSTRLFLENAKGSFGLCVVSSLDAERQVCFAARLVMICAAYFYYYVCSSMVIS